MRKLFLFLLLISFFTTSFFAQQFDLSADMRTRYENQYGYLKLRVPGQKATSFVSQRTRLNFDSKDTKLNFRLSLQNVREWGQDEGASLGRNSSSMYEAWAEVIVSKKISLKLGRQELVYDDQRIFGNIDWRQEGRTHDAFLLKYKVNKNHRLDFGLAYDADSYPRRHPIYGNEAGYIGFQHIWYHGDIGKFGVSVLALNRVLEYLKVSNPSG